MEEMLMVHQDDHRGAWCWTNVPNGPGVLNIRRKADGMSYFVAAADMRQRAYDAHKLLVAGKHHNPALQAAWSSSATPDEFEIVAAVRVRRDAFLSAFKQTLIEQSQGNCWNRKNSIASDSRDSCSVDRQNFLEVHPFGVTTGFNKEAPRAYLALIRATQASPHHLFGGRAPRASWGCNCLMPTV
ncbi:MAG: hypothetical protein QM754_16380 [Tepidisphaeraceae bacterium]